MPRKLLPSARSEHAARTTEVLLQQPCMLPTIAVHGIVVVDPSCGECLLPPSASCNRNAATGLPAEPAEAHRGLDAGLLQRGLQDRRQQVVRGRVLQPAALGLADGRPQGADDHDVVQAAAQALVRRRVARRAGVALRVGAELQPERPSSRGRARQRRGHRQMPRVWSTAEQARAESVEQSWRLDGRRRQRSLTCSCVFCIASVARTSACEQPA